MEVPERRGGVFQLAVDGVENDGDFLWRDDQDALANDAEEQTEDQADAGQ